MKSTLYLALAGAAAASPITSRTDTPNPVLGLAKAYTLIVNVTDIAWDFPDTPVHGLKVVGVHAGAGLKAPTVHTNFSDVYFTGLGDGYVEVRQSGGGPDFPPYSWRLYDDDPSGPPSPGARHSLGINMGPGTKGFFVSHDPNAPRPCPAFFAGGGHAGTFAVCDKRISAPGHPRFQIEFIEGTANAPKDTWYVREPNVPADCVQVRLLPQCAEGAPGDGKSSDGLDLEVRDAQCYRDVAGTNWGAWHRCW